MVHIARLTGYIRLTRGSLDILQDPLFTALRHQFPAQNTVLGKVHVGGEDVRILTVQRLALEVLAQRTMACVIVLQGVVTVR